jgi:hypothetical protein
MASDGITLQRDFESFLRKMVGDFAPYPFLRSEEQELECLASSIVRPFTVAVFGRMKTGKSSLINAMLGRPLAITGVEEATATINWISHCDAGQEHNMVVHWKDGRVEPMPLERLEEWSGKADEVIERVRRTSFLQLYSVAERLREVQIVDTPGTGSVAEEHEDVAKKFLDSRAAADSGEEGRKADALLYVFPPVARESDEGTLNEFRHTRLPGSAPYNSIGVLHKWDGMEEEDLVAAAKHKADKLYDVLKDVVSTIIPVSAPLALAARHAPDSYFTGLLEVLPTPGDKMRDALKRDSRWDEDPARNGARAAYPPECLPWVCFRRIVKLAANCGTSAELRQACLDASGVEELERELDLRFFRRSAIIKQRLARVKSLEPIRRGILKFNSRIEDLQIDIRNFRYLRDSFAVSPGVRAWLVRGHDEAVDELEKLEEWTIEADRRRLVEEDRLTAIENDFEFLEAMDKYPSLVEDRDRETIRALLNRLGAPGSASDIPREVLAALERRYQNYVNAPSQDMRKRFEHLLARLYGAQQCP